MDTNHTPTLAEVDLRNSRTDLRASHIQNVALTARVAELEAALRRLANSATRSSELDRDVAQARAVLAKS